MSIVSNAVDADQDLELRGFCNVWHRLADLDRMADSAEAHAAALVALNGRGVWRVLRDMPVGLVLYDADFNIVYQNAASEAMTGYPTAEYGGQSPLGLWIEPQERAFVESQLKQMREERVALHGRGVHLRPNGKRSWVQWATTPVFDGAAFAGYLGLHTNLSEEVREARHKTQLLVDAVVDVAIVQLSPSGRIQSWNRRSAAMFGLEAAQAMNLPIEALLCPGQAQPGLAASLLAVSADKGRAEHEGWLVHAERGRFWGNLLLYPQVDEEGQHVAHALVVRDLNERRRAEEQIRESEALLNSIVSAASDAILGVDEYGYVVFANPAAERIFGEQGKPLKGGPLPEILRGAEASALLAGRNTLSGHAADGRVLHLEVSVSSSTSGSRALQTLVVRDVTERVESDKALRRYRDQLAALARDLMEAEQKTSRRLAQLLHDQLGQTFTSLRIYIDALRAQLPSQQPNPSNGGEARNQRSWDEVSSLIDRGMGEVRGVLTELRPVLLEEQGLAVALDNEAQAQALMHPGVEVRLLAPPEMGARRFEADAEYAAFMVAREALGNALLHARCKRVLLKLEAWGENGFQLAVQDDGAGIEVIGRAWKPGHLGMVGMRERAHGIGAELRVLSSEDAPGTTIELRVHR